MNARNYLYIRKYNPPSAKRRADNKLETKRMLLRNSIPTPNILKVFSDRKSIKEFDWNLPPAGFALKPARGYGGEGIIVFKKWNGESGETISGREYTIKQLESHILDIFDGVHSLQALPDKAYIEEKIVSSAFFKRFAAIGLPDIRVIVFNKVPVMAMLRIPTDESKGKANLHLGAIGVGIDLRTGITKRGVLKDHPISLMPNTKIKTRGIRIPGWDNLLLLATKTQVASRLGYAGVDIVIDAVKGPLVLEINARPGLSIQNANLSSLRSRLERVENINIASIERGVAVAKSLFAEEFSEKVSIEPKVLSVIEPITIIANGVERTCDAKLDSGAYRTSLDAALAEELGLVPLKRKFFVQSASGQSYRLAVNLTFVLAGKKITTVATITDRSHLRYPIIIGRRDLKGFLLNPQDAPNEEELQVEEAQE